MFKCDSDIDNDCKETFVNKLTYCPIKLNGHIRYISRLLSRYEQYVEEYKKDSGEFFTELQNSTLRRIRIKMFMIIGNINEEIGRRRFPEKSYIDKHWGPDIVKLVEKIIQYSHPLDIENVWNIRTLINNTILGGLG